MVTDAILRHAYRLGLDLGRSDEALENHPTRAQETAARDSTLAAFPELGDHSPDWWHVFAHAFETGYQTGKLDPEGARRRVAIKRRMARSAGRQSSGARLRAVGALLRRPRGRAPNP